MKTKNITKVLLVVAITILLVGLVSAAAANKTSTNKVVKDSVKSSTKTLTKSAKIVSDNTQTKKTINKKVNKTKKGANTYSTSVSSYDELAQQIEKVKTSNYDSFTINLKKNNYQASSNLTFTDCSRTKTLVINGNGASINGKNNYQFITVGEGHKLTINNIKLNNFKTGYDGGAAVYNKKGTVTIKDSEFSNNYAIYGGAISNQEGNMTITNNKFTSNSAEWDGGVIISYKGSITVNNNEFKNNIATKGSSGAIESDFTSLKANNNIFYNNTAKMDGGAITNYMGQMNLKNNNFTKNSAENGGAIDLYGAYGSYTQTNYDEWGEPIGSIKYRKGYGTNTIENNNFKENKATSGGAIGYNFEMMEGLNSESGIDLTDNSMGFDDLAVNINNNLFENNQAETASVLSSIKTLQLKNNTMKNNNPTNNTGKQIIIIEDYNNQITHKNNIVYYQNINNIISDDYKTEFAKNNILVDSAAYPTKITIKISNTKAYIGQTVKATITLKDNKNHILANEKITLKIGTKTYTVKTNSKGTVTVTHKTTKTGTTKVTANYAGTIQHQKIIKNINIKVLPKVKTKLVLKLSKSKVKVKDKIKVTVTLKNKSNKAIKNQKVAIKIGSKTYTKKTNKKGTITLTYKVVKSALGKAIKATYNGNYMYLKSNASKKLLKA